MSYHSSSSKHFQYNRFCSNGLQAVLDPADVYDAPSADATPAEVFRAEAAQSDSALLRGICRQMDMSGY